ncbi:hypothetical protein Taro_024901 [Colocasia esculenta]|uniref:Receptor-like serine/threonine-protein kinase n=1 Tax=Colocasia esculenta TaxID=4460 RepID=A0A843VEZ7_COLES|nr:hypothetical protein [Colocasia esculenta]
MDPSKRLWLSFPVSLLNLIFLVSLFGARPTFAASSISAEQSLSGDQTLTSSPGGNFVLGFFSPTRAEPRKFYIGIWYGKVSQSQKTVVWVANREAPVSDNTTSELRIAGDGNLVLLDRSGTLVWSTNATSVAANSTVAELLDSGNLVLRDGSNSSGRVLWQSIDNPTDHWLPGGKLGLNKVTGKNQRLTSWRNSEDPAPGIFSLEIDPNGASEYLILWNQSRVFWRSGTWNGQIFSLVPEMTSNYVYDFQYITTPEENYFNYSMKPNVTLISRFMMDLSGQIKQRTWVDNTGNWILFWSQPRAQCDVYMLCGPFGICNERSLPFCSCLRGFSEASPGSWNLSDFTGGCARRTPLLCPRNGTSVNGGDQDRFLRMDNIKLPDNYRLSLSAVTSAGECESSCLRNCSCTAYSYDGRCSMWFGELTNLQQLGDGGGTLYLRLAASELPNSKSSKGKIIGVAVGAAAVMLGAIALALALLWRRRRRRFKALRVVDGTLVPFRYGDLRWVTKNFSEKLGGGGFGSVFKGTMPDSTQVAVKKLEGIFQGEKQFRTEVSTIGTIQHVNLVRLRGFCSEGTRRLLVYDYMPKGSLDTVMFRDCSPVVDWGTRYQIILGTARGLAYLHEKCRDCIIHCDIKPENILLDASFLPKVADFGLAKLVGRDFSRVLTTMRGTRGYLAPEWISGVPITAKADVYSFGMMVFEIVSGRRNSDPVAEVKNWFFPTWAASRLGEGDMLGPLDPRLHGDARMEELERVWRVAFWCIQDEESCRPTMGQVVQILEGVVVVNMPPVPRSLQLFGDKPESIVFFTDGGSQVASSNMISSNSQNKSTTSTSSMD